MGVLCDDGCTVTIDQIDTSIQNNGEEVIKGTINKKTGMWELPLGPQQAENVLNNILGKTSKPELSQYLHAYLFSPTTATILKVIKQVFMKMWPGLTEKSPRNTFINQGIQQWDTYT